MERECNLVAGSPGAGKSTFAADYIKGYKENVLLYKHIANIEDQAFSFLPAKSKESWRQGAHPGAPVKCKIPGSEEEYVEFLQWVKKHYRNGLLVIDDATIFERDRLTKEMNHLVTMRRHYGLDIWLIYHGLTLLPIEQFIFCNHVIIFNCNDNMKYKANKLPDYPKLKTAVETARANFRSGNLKLRHTPAIVKLA